MEELVEELLEDILRPLGVFVSLFVGLRCIGGGGRGGGGGLSWCLEDRRFCGQSLVAAVLKKGNEKVNWKGPLFKEAF